MDGTKFIEDYKKILGDAFVVFSVSEEKLQKIKDSGVDLMEMVPSEGKEIPIGEYLKSSNKIIEELLSVTDDFVAKNQKLFANITEQQGDVLLSEMKWLFTKEGIKSSEEKVRWVMNELSRNPSILDDFKKIAESEFSYAITNGGWAMTPLQSATFALQSDAFRRASSIAQIDFSIEAFLRYILNAH